MRKKNISIVCVCVCVWKCDSSPSTSSSIIYGENVGKKFLLLLFCHVNCFFFFLSMPFTHTHTHTQKHNKSIFHVLTNQQKNEQVTEKKPIISQIKCDSHSHTNTDWIHPIEFSLKIGFDPFHHRHHFSCQNIQ